MACVALICLYDHRALGLRAIANALQAAGHQVAVIHFKLPVQHNADSYLAQPTHYEAVHSSDLNQGFGIRRYNYDVCPWTDTELGLLHLLLAEIDPQVVGLSTRSVYLDYLPILSQALSGASRALKVAGGYGATFNPQEHLPWFDYVCRGEGVAPMLQLAEAVDLGLPMEEVDSLMFRRGGRLVETPLAAHSPEDYLYSFAMTSVDHYVIDNDQAYPADILLQSVPVSHADSASYHTMAGLGCLNRCSFCCAGKMVDLHRANGGGQRRRRLRPVENILDELEFARNYGFRHVVFLDSFLVGPTSYLLELFAGYRERVGLNFFAQLAPRQIIDHPQVLEAAVAAGLDFTVVGLQSGSDRINREIYHRDMPQREALTFAGMLAAYPDVRYQYHLITHNPLDDDQSHRATLELLDRLPKEQAELVLLRLRPFAGTDIAQMIQNQSPPSARSPEEEHKRALHYLCRYLLGPRASDQIMRDAHDYPSLRSRFLELYPTKSTRLASKSNRLGGDALLFEVRRNRFGEAYRKALDLWLAQPIDRHLRDLTLEYQKAYWSQPEPAASRGKIDLSGLFAGYGWGPAESNVHQQTWRWLGPLPGSLVLLRLEPGRGYLLETEIHTAQGEALFDLACTVNGEPLAEQGVLREGDRFFHRLVIPRKLVDRQHGQLKLNYHLSGKSSAGGEERLMALSRLAFKPADGE